MRGKRKKQLGTNVKESVNKTNFDKTNFICNNHSNSYLQFNTQWNSILSGTAPAVAFKSSQSLASPLAPQKTASETPYEATEPKYQTPNTKQQFRKPKSKKI